MVDLISARYGIPLTADDVVALGKRVLKTEHQFNLAAGMNENDDRLPEFFNLEPLAPHMAIWDFSGKEIDEFWNF